MRSQWNRLSVSLRLNIIAIILLTLLLASLGFTFSQRAKVVFAQRNAKLVGDEAEVIRQQFARVEEEMVTDTKALVIQANLIAAIQENDTASLQTISALSAASLDFNAIDLYAADGSPLLPDTANQVFQREQEAQLVELGLSGNELTSLLIQENNVHLASVISIRDEQDAIIAVILTQRNFDEDFLRELNFSRPGITLAIVKNGQVLVQNNLTEETGVLPITGLVLDEAAIDQTVSGQTIVEKDSVIINEKPYQAAYVPLAINGENQATILVLLDVNEDIKFLRTIIFRVLIIIPLAIVIEMAIFTYFTSRTVKIPLKGLTDVATELSNGNYDIQTADTSQNEIGKLSQAFNDMIVAIKEREQALREMTDSLEIRVAERTAELESSNKQLEFRASQIQIINEITSELVSELNLDRLFSLAAHRVQQLSIDHHVGIFLLEEDRLKLKAIAGPYKSFFSPDHIQDIGTGINGWVATNGKTLLANDVSKEPRFTMLISEEIKTQAELSVPIIFGSKTLGVLDIQSPRQDTFNQSDVFTIEALASQLAIAVENARLYEDAVIANRLKSELLAKVSHELRTPLGAILGFAGILSNGVYGSVSTKQKETLEKIIKSGKYLNLLVNDLLDVAKQEANTLNIFVEPFSPANLVSDVYTEMAVLAQAKDLALTYEVTEDIPPTLIGDSTRLRQMLINLVNNAIKFTEQGTIQIRVSRPDIDHWQIQVADTGIGMTIQAQSFIFEPFRQVDGSYTRKYGGAGLGLSIVNQLVDLMQGKIIVESEIDKGSIFTVLLPLEIAQEKIQYDSD